MKRIFTLCIFTAFLMLLSGCMFVSFEGRRFGDANVVHGTGSRVSEDFTVSNFNGIDIDGDYVIIFNYSVENSVTVYMQENLFEYLNVSVQNEILRVNSDRPFSTTTANRPRIYVYAPALEYMSLSGAVTAEDWDTVNAHSFSVNASGAVSGTISINVSELDITVSGAADLELSGSASSAHISLSGAGNIEAENLQTENTVMIVAGAGNAVIAVSHSLTVTISGTGSVEYIGEPSVTQTIAGLGTVRRRQ
jgi:hypothetical protein